MVLGFVGERASIMRSVRELKVKECEMMGWCSIRNFNTAVRMALATLIFGSIGDAPTLYGLQSCAPSNARNSRQGRESTLIQGLCRSRNVSFCG